MHRILILLVLFVQCYFIFAQENASSDKSQYHFAITRPTVYNLQRLIFLVENKLIQIPDLTVLAVYYDKEDYDYNESLALLNLNNLLVNIEFYKLTGELNKDNIYTINDLTPQFEEIFNKTNGILFFGGDDLPPYTYSEKMELTTVVEDTYRHFFELSFLYHLVGNYNQESDFSPLLEKKNDYLVWTFCLSTQTLNVTAGGSLIQDIPTELYNMKYVEDVLEMPGNQVHKNYYKVLYPEKGYEGSKLHQISIPDSSYLMQFTNENKSPFINSYHHQCIDFLGKDLYPIAFSLDKKIIEAVKHKRFKNVLGLQFHPEKTELYDPSKKLLHSPKDSSQLSYFDILNNNNSYQFHVNIWKEFSKTLLILNH